MMSELHSVSDLRTSMSRRYASALLLIAALSTLSFGFVHRLIATHQSSAAVINLSGRQRMLSQKLALLAQLPESPGFPEERAQALADFTRNHEALLHGDAAMNIPGQHSAAIEQIYFAPDNGQLSLDAAFRQYVTDVRNGADPRQIAREAAPLLAGLDRVVSQNQRESEARIESLQEIEAAIFLLTLGLLAIEALFIFRPMAGSIVDLFRKLTEAREVALRAIDAKSTFVAMVTHEIRTPMIGVQGITNLLLETPLNGPQRENVQTVQRLSDALILLVNDILDFSKIEAGKLTLERVPFDLAALLKDSRLLFEQSARKKDLELVYDAAPETLRIWNGDPLRINQVLTNFLGNAMKFTPATGKIALSVALVPGAENRLRFTVRDTGVGIPLEQQARLFRRYEQAESSTARNFGGTGLGLSICKKIVELMGGDIGFKSEPGHGTEFWFTIPLTTGEIVTKPTLTRLPTSHYHGLRVLLAEDNPVNQKIAEVVLKRMGLVFDVAANGREAVELYKARSYYDLVLMDCEMPELDGFAATRLIREMGGKSARIFALTAHEGADVETRCREAGMDGVIRKPFRAIDVEHALVEVSSLARTGS